MRKTKRDGLEKKMEAVRERLARKAWDSLKADAVAILQDPLLEEFVYAMGSVFFTKPLRSGEKEWPVVVGQETTRHCLIPGEAGWDMRGLGRTTKRRMSAFDEDWEWYLDLFGNPGPVRFGKDGVERTDW